MCGGAWSPAQELWFYSSHSILPWGWRLSSPSPVPQRQTSVPTEYNHPRSSVHSNSSDLGHFLTVDVDHRELDVGYSLNRTLLPPPYFIATLRTNRKTGLRTSEDLCCANCMDSHEKQVTESWWPWRPGVWPWVSDFLFFCSSVY